MKKNYLLYLPSLLLLFAPLSYANNLNDTNHSNTTLLEQEIDEVISPHTTLNPYFFTKEKFNLPIEQRLQQVGHYFFAKIKNTFPKAKLVDILFVGSLAGYGYTKESDIDIHLVVDFSNVSSDQKLINEYLALLSDRWHHQKMSLGAYSIQITPLSIVDDQGGTYSLLSDRWIQKPHYQKVPYTKEELLNTIKEHQNEIIKLEKNYTNNNHLNILDCLKIKNFESELRLWRSKGLKQVGVMSKENITYRILRSLGDLDNLQMVFQRCETEALDSILNRQSINQ